MDAKKYRLCVKTSGDKGAETNAAQAGPGHAGVEAGMASGTDRASVHDCKPDRKWGKADPEKCSEDRTGAWGKRG